MAKVPLVFILALLAVSVFLYRLQSTPIPNSSPKFADILPLSPSPLPTPSPSPTPKPLTFAEMNALYGPCTRLPTLMYHHIQDQDSAAAKNQTSLTVNPDTFRQHLDYLQTQGYTSIAMSDLASFFNSGTPLSTKPVLLTFDDAYADFVTVAAPILREFNFKATIFTPTGLVENPDYLTWSDMTNLAASGLFHFANHTWSHRNAAVSPSEVEREITTADQQLTEHNLNSPKVFAYPYGIPGNYAETLLADLGYQLAFTTRPGTTLCLKQRFELPRLRIGNSQLSNYGF